MDFWIINQSNVKHVKMVSFGYSVIHVIEVNPVKPLIPTTEYFTIMRQNAKKKRDTLSRLSFQQRLQTAMNKYAHEQWKITLTKEEWEEIISAAYTLDKETKEFCDSM